jgi:hypothetical protein
MKYAWIAFILGFAIHPDFARAEVEPQDPASLCDRFLGGAQDSCAKKMKEMKPDWYLAAVCNLQSDDKLFYQCLSKGVNLSFSPRDLEACSSTELSDQERMSCIDKARTTLASSFQNEKISNRKPASLLPAKKKP